MIYCNIAMKMVHRCSYVQLASVGMYSRKYV
jgi:hypothetical protein